MSAGVIVVIVCLVFILVSVVFATSVDKEINFYDVMVSTFVNLLSATFGAVVGIALFALVLVVLLYMFLQAYRQSNPMMYEWFFSHLDVPKEPLLPLALFPAEYRSPRPRLKK